MPNLTDLSANWSLEFATNTGGALKACKFKGHEILRAAVSNSDPRHMSAFPMIPFIGRITNGVFAFNGEHFRLTPNMPPEPHAIHGNGWQTPWKLDTHTDGTATLFQTYDAKSDWPWSYEAKQTFSAQGETLTLTLSLTNTSTSPMPAGFGWHPYFPKDGATIRADVSKVWTSADDSIVGDRPQPLTAETDLTSKRSVSDLNLDHCFTAGDGGVTLDWPNRGLSLDITASEPLRHLTVYIPPGENYFCVEPVSHAPDAINSSLAPDLTGLNVLQADETLEAAISLQVSLADTT